MENNVKQLNKNPFKMDNKLQKEKEAMIKLIDKYSKEVEGDDKLAKAVETMLVKTQDPIKLWIKSNVLDQLGYVEWAVQFKLKAEELGYVVNGVAEAISVLSTGTTGIETKVENHDDGFSIIQGVDHVFLTYDQIFSIYFKTKQLSRNISESVENNYVANVNFKFKNDIGLDAFKEEMNRVLSNNTIIENLIEHAIEYNTQSLSIANNMENTQQCECEEGTCQCSSTNENLNTETGLQITGSTQIDNQKIGDILDNLGLENEWMARDGYWLVKCNEEDYDATELNIQREFDNDGVNAKFEGIFENFTQQFTYEPRELKPWNIFKDEDKTEKPELNAYAVYKLIEAHPMLKFAYDQLKTGDFEKDMKMMFDTYVKKDDDLSDTLKTYESYTSYLVESANNNKYANKIYELLDVYELTQNNDDSDNKLLALVINKMTKLINNYIDNEQQMFALYTPEVKQALVAAFDELTILEIIEKFKSAGFTIEDLKQDENKLNLDDLFGIPPSATNLILYTLTSIDTTDLLYLDQEIATIIFMASTAMILKSSIGLSID